MLSFFDSITSFISTIWGYVQNTFEIMIEMFTFLATAFSAWHFFVPSLPSLVAVGCGATISIMIARFLLLK